MKLTVHKSANVFNPRLPAIPWLSSKLTFRMRLDKSWWDCEHLTEPTRYGLKLMTLGGKLWPLNLNYHEGGANFGLGKEGNQVFIWPRYYEPIQGGLYKLNELHQFKIEVFPDTWYKLELTTDRLTWRIDGRLIAAVNLSVPHGWLHWPFLGRSGNDNRYTAEPIPGAWAARDFQMEIKL